MQVVRIMTTLFLFQMAMLIRKIKLVQSRWGSNRRPGRTCEARSIIKERKRPDRQRSRRKADKRRKRYLVESVRKLLTKWKITQSLRSEILSY